MNDNDRIISKTKLEQKSCTCVECASQCERTPCLGTPDDVLKIMKSDHGVNLDLMIFAAGYAWGFPHPPIPMVQLRSDDETGHCIMYRDGLCGLHKEGLKPLEGTLTHHDDKPVYFKDSAGWEIAKCWISRDNEKLVTEIFDQIMKVKFRRPAK